VEKLKPKDIPVESQIGKVKVLVEMEMPKPARNKEATVRKVITWPVTAIG